MKTYSNSSNANRAAKELVAKHDTLEVAKAIKQDDGTYVAAVHVTMGTAPEAIKGFARVVPKESTPVADLPDAREQHSEEAPKVAPKPDAAPDAASFTMAAARASSASKAKPSGRKTKAGEAIELMSRKQGATAEELIKGFGWLPHTLRGFVSLTNKKRRGEGQPEIVATRKDGVTTYKIG